MRWIYKGQSVKGVIESYYIIDFQGVQKGYVKTVYDIQASNSNISGHPAINHILNQHHLGHH